MPVADGAFRTDDMALAAVLTSHEFKYTLERVQDSRWIIWAFECPDDRGTEFDQILEKYDEFEYRIEPRSFVQVLARVRRELHNCRQPPVTLRHSVRRADAPSA